MPKPRVAIEKRWRTRLDAAAREMNAFLIVLAIGLAVLDGTCFFAFKMRELLPPPRNAPARSVQAASISYAALARGSGQTANW